MKDLFSEYANDYSVFRPTYPKALYDIIFSHVRRFELAWDAGTGNGQVARDLVERFKKIHATDISRTQLDQAYQNEKIIYAQAAEETKLQSGSVDLITVAQAIHWFDRPKFYREVKRAARPDAVLAVWGYGLLRINPIIDPALRHFYKIVVGPFWDPERNLIDEQYQTIDFPFEEIQTPFPANKADDLNAPGFSFQWTLEALGGYLETWSAVKKFEKQHGDSPVPAFIDEIRAAWGSGTRTVQFPLFLRLAKL